MRFCPQKLYKPMLESLSALNGERGFLKTGEFSNINTQNPQGSSLNPEVDSPPKRNRIGIIQGFLMVGTASLFDGLQVFLTYLLIGLFINWIISIIAWTLLWGWFRLNEVNFWDQGTRKILTVGGSGLIEIIPGVNTFPAITFGVVILIVIVWLEDTAYNKTRGKVNIQTV